MIRQCLKNPPKKKTSVKEVKKEEKPPQIWAVDFDGTLTTGSHYPRIGNPNEQLIAILKAAQLTGIKLILWSCREGESLEEAVAWCREQGLEFDAVNDNIPEVVEAYGRNSRKVVATYYIDDRAFHFWGEDGMRYLCESLMSK